MRIALTGSGGTGKTVTALEIARLMRYEYINSQARFVFHELKAASMETDHNQDPDKFLTVQERILEAQIARELEVTDRAPNWVAERTALDSVAYCTFWAAAMPVAENSVWRRRHESVKARAVALVNRGIQHSVANSYDRVFVMPYGRVNLGGDVFRSGDALYQRVIDLMMTGLVMKKMADRTTIVPHLEAGETDTALWIIRQCGLAPVIPKEEWYLPRDADEERFRRANAYGCTNCAIQNRDHEVKDGVCTACGARVADWKKP